MTQEEKLEAGEALVAEKLATEDLNFWTMLSPDFISL